jgi:hypothetical protein
LGSILCWPRLFHQLITGVGSIGFVEYVKSALSALAKGRESKEAGDSYQLREPSAPHGEHFEVKNEDIGADNAYFWDINSE